MRVTGSIEERNQLAKKAGLDPAHLERVVQEDVPFEELVAVRDLWRQLFRAGVEAGVNGLPIGLTAIDKSRALGELLASMFERHQVSIKDTDMVQLVRIRLGIEHLSDQVSDAGNAQK